MQREANGAQDAPDVVELHEVRILVRYGVAQQPLVRRRLRRDVYGRADEAEEAGRVHRAGDVDGERQARKPERAAVAAQRAGKSQI